VLADVKAGDAQSLFTVGSVEVEVKSAIIDCDCATVIGT